MSNWPRMQFRFWGISVVTQVLIADATECKDFDTWAKSRGIDTKSGRHPYGERPVPEWVERNYPHEIGYVLQKDVSTFFD